MKYGIGQRERRIPHRRPHRGDPWRRVRIGVGVLVLVFGVGVVGYRLLGLSLLDAVYQTAFTVTTVGYGEIGEVDADYKVFTIVLILFGTVTALYTFGVLLETLIEGRLSERVWRQRMQRAIDHTNGHIVVCGHGRVGRAIAAYLTAAGSEVVVVDRASPSEESPYLFVEGEATDDDVLVSAGIERARGLVSALSEDADNLYVTVAARSMCPNLFIVTRANSPAATRRIAKAGANRVINPHEIGGSRMGALAAQPHVAEFLEGVEHDGDHDFTIQEFRVGPALVGRSLGDVAHFRDTGALVLAVRTPEGRFAHNPQPELVLTGGDIVIAMGDAAQLSALATALRG